MSHGCVLCLVDFYTNEFDSRVKRQANDLKILSWVCLVSSQNIVRINLILNKKTGGWLVDISRRVVLGVFLYE